MADRSNKAAYAMLVCMLATLVLSMLVMTTLGDGIARAETKEPKDEGYASSPVGDGIYETSTADPWGIEATDDLVYENITIIINENVAIAVGGVLTLRNCLIYMNNSGTDVYDWLISGTLNMYNCTLEHIHAGTPATEKIFGFVLFESSVVVMDHTYFRNKLSSGPVDGIDFGKFDTIEYDWDGAFVAIHSTIDVDQVNINHTDNGSIMAFVNTNTTELIGSIDWNEHGWVTIYNDYMHTITIEGENTTDYDIAYTDYWGNESAVAFANGSIPTHLSTYLPDYYDEIPGTIMFVAENVSIDSTGITYATTWPLTVEVTLPDWTTTEIRTVEYKSSNVSKYAYDKDYWLFTDAAEDALQEDDHGVTERAVSDDIGLSTITFNIHPETPRQGSGVNDDAYVPYDGDDDLVADDDEDVYYGGAIIVYNNEITPRMNSVMTVYRYDPFTLTANTTTADRTISTYAWTVRTAAGAVYRQYSSRYVYIANLTYPVGTYTVNLLVTDQDGCYDTASRTLTVVAPPTNQTDSGSLPDDDEEDDDDDRDWSTWEAYKFWHLVFWEDLWDDVLTSDWFIMIVLGLCVAATIYVVYRGTQKGRRGGRKARRF